MRSLLFILSPLLLGAAPAPAPASRTVEYTLAPELEGDAIVALRVTARFAGDRSGTTRFDWASDWAGEDHLAQWSRDLVVTGATATAPASHGGRIIHAAPGAPVTVTYRVVSAFAADPGSDDSEQPRPVVRPTWFYAVGEALFAVPEGRGTSPAHFAWTGPAGIGFASDLEHDHARPGTTAKTVDDISESIVIGGRDLRVTRMEAGGAPLRVATIGHYEFAMPALEAMAQKVVAAERSFWGDRDRQPFLVTMTPVAPAPARLSFSGTGRSDAFALWMDPRASLPSLAWLLAHEYFHTWNPRQLGDLGEGETERRRYWLSEGFTDFYARRLMLRAGLLTPEQFVASWNEMLAAYAASPLRTATNAAAAQLFWKGEAAEKLPYQRGAMLAALWDRRLRAAGRGGLDAVLYDQRRRAAAALTLPPLTALFARTAAAHGLRIAPDVTRYLDHGETIVLPRGTFGPCAAVEAVTRAVFVRGWDVAATEKAGAVAGLDPASPAYAAGLRDGMRLVRRISGTPGDSRVPYEIVVADGGVERTLRFLPAGRAKETLQQIVIDPARFAATPAACTASLAG